MKHIVTSSDYTPKIREDLEANSSLYKEEDGDLVNLLQSNIPNSYDRITLHKWDFKGEDKIIKGEYVIFDFDPKENDIEDKLDEIVVALNKVVGLDRDHLTIIFTGRGYHVLVKTIYDINLKFLKDTKKSYTEICKKLGKELEGVEVDPIFPKWHIRTRIPGRHNEKNNREVKLIQVAENLYADDFLAIRTPEENQQALKQNLITDSGRVLSECRFISNYKARPNKSYDDWLALGSNLIRLPDGEKVVHDYSREDCDGGYSEEETNNKIPEFKKLHFGCGRINELWDGCKECPHYNQIRFPTDLGRVHDGSVSWRKPAKTKEGALIEGKYQQSLKVKTIVDWLHEQPLYKVDGVLYAFDQDTKTWKLLIGGSNLALQRIRIRSIVQKELRRQDESIGYMGDDLGAEASWNQVLNTYLSDDRKTCTLNDLNPSHITFYNNGVYDSREFKFYPDSEGSVRMDYIVTESIWFDFFQGKATEEDFKDITFVHRESGGEDGDLAVSFWNSFCAHTYCSTVFGKTIFLLGEGSNGKSTLAHICEWGLGSKIIFKEKLGLFIEEGSENGFTSPVEFDNLNDPNELALMINSKLNVGHESEDPPKGKASSGVLSAFKKANTGEQLMVKWLYKDKVSKAYGGNLIFLMNDMTTLVKNEAMARRSVTIDGKYTYKTKDKFTGAEGTKLIDEGLQKRIIKQIPAYVAWCFEQVRTGKIKLYEDMQVPRDWNDFKEGSAMEVGGCPVSKAVFEIYGEENGGILEERWVSRKQIWNEDFALRDDLDKKEFDKFFDRFEMASARSKYVKYIDSKKRPNKAREYKRYRVEDNF
jgi:hypothetical protein